MTKQIDHERPWVILAMTDDASARMLAKMLAKRGAHVETVETAQAALSKATRQPTAAIMIEFSQAVVDEIKVLINHGIPIYAMNFGANHAAVAVTEATDKGIKEVFKMTDFESQCRTWLNQLRGRGNRFAEEAPDHVANMICGEDSYLVEELLEFPESTGLRRTETELEDEEGVAVEDPGNLNLSPAEEDQRGAESASQGETQSREADILEKVNRQVQHLLHQHQRKIERRVEKRLIESLVGQEVKIHEVASSIVAQQAEEIYEVVAEAITQASLSSSGVKAGDERESLQAILVKKRKQSKKARPKWINQAVQYIVIVVVATAVSAGVVTMILKFLR